MRHRLQTHILRGLGGERRAHAAGTMENELLVLLEDRLGVGACRIDPEFEHAARAGEGARYASVAFDLAGIADVHDHDVVALRGLDGIGRAQRFDLGVGFFEQRLDAAMDGLGHWIASLVSDRLSGTRCSVLPAMRSIVWYDAAQSRGTRPCF